ncbi:MAG TPA: DUF4230 domain-containing protein [Polyangiaceae bacterium]|jgi:hypothetical protein|nr:DUF4230 domain-containing protein [Polyangiaceae bacterium]
MTDSMLPEPKRLMPAGLVALAGMLAAGLCIGFWFTKSCSPPGLPVIPPLSSTVTVVRATPNVLVAVQDLARLESASFHMERVIDLSDKQSQLFGLIQSEDAILLVAVANVSAGVDLQKLTTQDISADPLHKTVKLTLPAPEVFHAELDNSKTYVHTRHTGALATRQENLETRARQEAERTLVDDAVQAGLLTRAGDNARRAVAGVVRALGYEQIEITVRPPAASPSSKPAASAPAQ